MKNLEDLEKKLNSELTTKINRSEIKHNQIYLETDKDDLIEIQGTAENAPFSKNELSDMLKIGSEAIADIIKKQKACIE